MRRMAELVDRRHGFQLVAAVDQNPRVARERRDIAGHRDHDRNPERAELKEVLQLLAENGGSVIDSSPMYGAAERVAGDLTSELKLRDKLFFATKVWVLMERITLA